MVTGVFYPAFVTFAFVAPVLATRGQISVCNWFVAIPVSESVLRLEHTPGRSMFVSRQLANLQDEIVWTGSRIVLRSRVSTNSVVFHVLEVN